MFSLAVFLVILNLWLFYFERWSNTDKVDRSVFVVNDTSQIDRISIAAEDTEIIINRNGDQWSLNGQYQVDEGLRRLFFSILQRVSVRKPVDIQPEDSIRVNLEGGLSREFMVFSNPTKTRTYFYDPVSAQSYEVEIPGYNEYLGGIFELTENQWRDRMILDENWRTIKSVSIDYTSPDRRDLVINFNDNFFSIDGVSEIDSSAVVDYLNQYQVFEVNEFISARRFPRYDSLSRTVPMANLVISSIKSNEPLQLSFFPSIEKNAFQLITNKAGELMILDGRRVGQILAEPSDFKAEE